MATKIVKRRLSYYKERQQRESDESFSKAFQRL